MSSNTEFLKKALSEFTDSLVRVDGEKDHQTAIIAQAKEKCQINPGHFKRLAMALHKDRLEAAYLDAGELMALVDTIRCGDEA